MSKYANFVKDGIAGKNRESNLEINKSNTEIRMLDERLLVVFYQREGEAIF